jgi:hypothetical protein
MRARWWVLFAACSLGWAILSAELAPNMSAVDVFYFRDAGWNLAAWGHFESAALAGSHDLAPRLYAHYTPLMPLLFAGYLGAFPRNAYAGTFFNLLLGLGAAAMALNLVLRQSAGRLRTAAALTIAVLPVVFITYDRPEALGLIFAAMAIAVAAGGRPRPQERPWAGGLLIALAFLAHPFAAAIAALWIAALYLAFHWDKPGRWLLTLRDVAIAGAMTVVGIAPVALAFYRLDPTSLHRFATNAFVVNSDIGLTAKSGSIGGFIHNHLHLNTSPLQTAIYFLSLASLFLLAVWAVARRRDLHAAEGMPIAAGLLSVVCALTLFPGHPHYVRFLALLVPMALLIANPSSDRLRTPALGLLLFAVAINLPNLAIDVLQRIEQLPSYRAAQSQPATLLAAMPAPEAIVVLQGDSYDVFKPRFRHMIELAHVEDDSHSAQVAALVNCYDAFHGPDSAVRPFPPKLDEAEYHLIQADPAHLWLTLFGRRLMRAQWGYGCDLYVRNTKVSE